MNSAAIIVALLNSKCATECFPKLEREPVKFDLKEYDFENIPAEWDNDIPPNQSKYIPGNHPPPPYKPKRKK